MSVPKVSQDKPWEPLSASPTSISSKSISSTSISPTRSRSSSSLSSSIVTNESLKNLMKEKVQSILLEQQLDAEYVKIEHEDDDWEIVT